MLSPGAVPVLVVVDMGGCMATGCYRHAGSLNLSPRYGCRVIQKALQVMDPARLVSLVHEFEGVVAEAIHDQNGNHCIQKCIEVMNSGAQRLDHEGGPMSAHIQFIVDACHGTVCAKVTQPREDHEYMISCGSAVGRYVYVILEGDNRILQFQELAVRSSGPPARPVMSQWCFMHF